MAQRSEYATIQKILHWLIAIAVIGMLASGVYMTTIGFDPKLPKATVDLRNQLYTLHKSTGFVVLGLMLLRIALRLLLGAPRLPASVAPPQRFAAGAAQLALYALLIATPIAGWAAVSVGGFMEPVYGLFNMPPLMEKSGKIADYFDIARIHMVLGFAIIAVLGAHIGGAMLHLLILRDGVFKRMWF
ncbi:MAG: cytochrome b/b6 domain-containing protein [Neomegalonema sp.]|nr:cytochrome b/b6 domain-containing protein [Neomegalonema sp.]